MLQQYIDYRKLGGWLMAFFVFTILGIVLGLFGMATLLFGRDLLLLSGQYTPISYLVAMAISLVSLILSIIIVLFISKRNPQFKLIYIVSIVVSLPYTIFSLVQLMSTAPALFTTNLITNIVSIGISVAWIFYFQKSQRLKVYLLSDAEYNNEYMRLRQAWEQQMAQNQQASQGYQPPMQ